MCFFLIKNSDLKNLEEQNRFKKFDNLNKYLQINVLKNMKFSLLLNKLKLIKN